MNPELLRILDQTVLYSIWVFLVTYLIILLVARGRLKRRIRRVGELYADAGLDTKALAAEKLRTSRLNQWRIALNSLFLALTLGALFFVAFSFVPMPYVQNLVSSTAWQITPLRLTALTYDRFYEGFSLEGEVWNQTNKSLEALTVTVVVVGTDEKPLDELVASITPEPLPPGRPGQFQVRYAENSPFIKGYTISFVDQEGEIIPHVTGFDAVQ